MSEVRLQPQLTQCPIAHGQLTNSDGITRHSAMIRLLGECRICHMTRLYQGEREEMIEEISEALLSIYVDRSEEATWGVEDTFFASVLNLAEEELPEHVNADSDLEVDYDTEGLRIIHQALLRAAGKIDRHLNAAGEEV